MTTVPDLMAALSPVLALLEDLDVEYAIGGSVASSAYGFPRATMDVDLVAVIDRRLADRFEQELGGDYYVSAEMIRDAIQARSSFNLIHRSTMMKIDIFIAENTEFARSVQKRRRRTLLTSDPAGLEAWLLSPEDVILRKLEWARRGDTVSEVQWHDVVGVIRVQTSLDIAYLRRWAAILEVGDLLEDALTEAGSTPV